MKLEEAIRSSRFTDEKHKAAINILYTAYWLKNERPFDPDAIVEVVVELLVTSLRCAAQLDPQLDVSDAVAKLSDSAETGR